MKTMWGILIEVTALVCTPLRVISAQECLPSAVTKCGSECHCLNNGNCGTTCNGQCDLGWTGTQCQTRDPTQCDAGKYGSTCQQNCNCQNYQSAACDKKTGACSGPCKVGFYNSACAAKCPCQYHKSIACDQTTGACSGPCKAGYWGRNCQINCSCPNRQSTTCNRDSGVCTALCGTGFTGPNCQPVTTTPTTCRDGLYGRLCNQNCSCPAYTSAACDRMTGTCTGVECKTQLFGTNCDKVCNCGKRVSPACDKLSGRCTSPCRNGLTTPDCGIVITTPANCPEGKYGTNCKKTCDCPNRITSACDRLNGGCTSPCSNGLTTQNCETETTTCPSGKYGSNCEQNCNCPNRLTDACNRITALCTSDCSAGVTGPNCQQTAESQVTASCAIFTTCDCSSTGWIAGVVVLVIISVIVFICLVVVILKWRRIHNRLQEEIKARYVTYKVNTTQAEPVAVYEEIGNSHK